MERQQHLSRIATIWTVVRNAHDDLATRARDAQAALVERYSPAAHRYLLKVLRDADAADEVFQEFALRMLQGGLRGADPARGRFRDYIKTTLINLARDHGRRRQRDAKVSPLGTSPPELQASSDDASPEDAQFIAVWRDELMSRAWEALAAIEKETGRPYHAVLRLRTEHADASSSQLARLLSERVGGGRDFTDAHARKLLQRARERFADLLLDEVARSIGDEDIDTIERELIEIGLLRYCQSAVTRRRR